LAHIGVLDCSACLRKSKPPERPIQLPPVPDWKPEIDPLLDRIVERLSFYTNGARDFAVFKNGTVVILPDGLTDINARAHAEFALHKVFHAHPDMNPLNMKDGNILIQYNHDVANLVLSDITEVHWDAIDANHQRALATYEVLITPLGQNVFDDFGKKSLFGRCFMFMDAQSPRVVQVVRHNGGQPTNRGDGRR
jgi:hypothetical protein